MTETEALREKLKEYEEKISTYEQSGIVGFYFAMNRKLNEMAEALNDTLVKLDSDDKVFERFMKIAVESRDTVENLLFLETKIKEIFKVEDIDETKGSKTPLIETVIKQRNARH